MWKPINKARNEKVVDGNAQPSRWSDFHSRKERVETHQDSLDSWIQGDILVDLPVTWVAPAGDDAILESSNNSDGPTLYHLPVKMPLAIICSQTCDISGSGVGSRHPFVLVAPLLGKEDLGSDLDLGNARARNVGFLFPVTVPESHSQNTEWFADFRMIFPVSKSLLISPNVQRLPNKLSEQELLDFAEVLAFKFRRPALSESLSRLLPESLNAMVKDSKSRNQGNFDKLEQVRALVTSGDRLTPAGVTLYVLTEEDQVLTQADKDLWDSWLRKSAITFKGISVVFGPTIFTSAIEMSAEEYRNTIQINVKVINTKLYW